MKVQTYLYFEGNCREAIEFYEGVFGASVIFLMTYREMPEDLVPNGWSDKIFHATVQFGDTLVNMSDSEEEGATGFGGFSMLVHADSEDEATRLVASLKQGGKVRMPLQKTPWSPCYGIVRDNFGITWKIQT